MFYDMNPETYPFSETDPFSPKQLEQDVFYRQEAILFKEPREPYISKLNPDIFYIEEYKPSTEEMIGSSALKSLIEFDRTQETSPFLDEINRFRRPDKQLDILDEMLRKERRPSYDDFALLSLKPQVDTLKDQRKVTGKKARLFRRQKLRAGAMGELLDDIGTDTDMRAQIAPLIKAREAFQKDTTSQQDTHRDLSALFSALFSSGEELKERTVAALDESATQESDSLKQEMRDDNKPLQADVVIIGAGTHGSIIAARLRAENPDARIIAVEQADMLGGQFRKYGTRSTFFINSRNHRPQNNGKSALPGRAGNLNTFGEKAPVQTTDISSETYPTNLELGHTSAINQYLSAETVLGVTAESVDAETGDVTVRDTSTNEVYSLRGSKIVMTTGLGERETPTQTPGLMTAEELLSHFGNSENEFPMQDFVDKKIAIIGGGDSGRICAELFTRLAPKDAYGRSVTQLGGPDSISWYGTDFSNRDEFCATNRPRYQQLASFIADPSRLGDGIRAFKRRVKGITPASRGIQLTDVNDISEGVFDVVIDARTLPNPKDIPSQITNARFRPVLNYLKTSAGISELGLATDNGRVYLAGPAAQSRLNTNERSTYSNKIGENTVAIWANSARSEEIAQEIGKTL